MALISIKLLNGEEHVIEGDAKNVPRFVLGHKGNDLMYWTKNLMIRKDQIVSVEIVE